MDLDREAKASMSIFDAGSLLSRLNRNETDTVDRHIAFNLRLADSIGALSDGRYDVTVKPLVEAWGFAGSRLWRIRTSIRSSPSWAATRCAWRATVW